MTKSALNKNIRTKMDRLQKIKRVRDSQGVSWDRIAELLPITAQAIRMAFERGSFKEVYLIKIEKMLDIKAGMPVE